MRSTATAGVLILLCWAAASTAALGAEPAAGAESAPDPKMVLEKIQGLGAPDLPQNFEWLTQRRAQVLPQLIAGLDDPKRRVAGRCLLILTQADAGPEFREALIRIAQKPDHPIYAEATLELAALPLAADPRVPPILKEAMKDAQHFPKPQDRAKLALAAGMKDEAVALLTPLTKDKDWSVGRQYYLELARLDPKGHGLTPDQKTFVEKAAIPFKWTEEEYRARSKKLAALNREEIRPFVMQMLESSGPYDDVNARTEALRILEEWRDKAALPQVRQLVLSKPRLGLRETIEAYLAIDGGETSDKEVLALMRPDEKLFHDDHNDQVLRGVVCAPIPDSRKVALLRNASAALPVGDRWEIANALSWHEGDIAPLLAPLMREEEDIGALSAYAALAAQDKEKRFGKEVLRAVERLAATPVPYNAESFDRAGAGILDAAAQYELKDARDAAAKLAQSDLPATRLAAAGLLAKFGPDEGSRKLIYDQLGSDKPDVRMQAAETLARVPIKDDAERQRRETALLAHLGKPSEDYALRLLAACGGERTVRALMPILDEEDVPRAVYAAWVLAQLRDKAAAEAGLRRLAIYAMFHYIETQADIGFCFSIAPHLDMSDVPLIPRELRRTFPLRKGEAGFAIRAYRYANGPEPGYDMIVMETRFLNEGGLSVAALTSREQMDATYLPLLEVAAKEDPYFVALYLQGKRVPHFSGRQAAAKAIARITGKPASYIGLDGAPLDSAATPQAPYKDQTKLLTAFFREYVRRAEPKPDPLTGQMTNLGYRVNQKCASFLDHLQEKFGEDVGKQE